MSSGRQSEQGWRSEGVPDWEGPLLGRSQSYDDAQEARARGLMSHNGTRNASVLGVYEPLGESGYVRGQDTNTHTHTHTYTYTTRTHYAVKDTHTHTHTHTQTQVRGQGRKLPDAQMRG